MDRIIDTLEFGGGKNGSGTAIADAAKRIRCEEDYLRAIIEVESGGDAFDRSTFSGVICPKHYGPRHNAPGSQRQNGRGPITRVWGAKGPMLAGTAYAP